MELKAAECFFFGYSANSPDKRVFNRAAGIIELACHVDINVFTTPPIEKGPDWVFDYKHLFESFNVFSDVSMGELETIIRSRDEDASFFPRTVVSPASAESASEESTPIKAETNNARILVTENAQLTSERLRVTSEVPALYSGSVTDELYNEH
ncbi:hypothetical protein QVD17_30864 [Tagetes erecta]|uniref:Uncharacterized protein n=1 Tax=Tagetes erecta TaxID=13708 RepID=A0AAD8K3C7_TARER|nr:hypothetical protein QVD17_30864 [Tagetes erecta]